MMFKIIKWALGKFTTDGYILITVDKLDLSKYLARPSTANCEVDIHSNIPPEHFMFLLASMRQEILKEKPQDNDANNQK